MTVELSHLIANETFGRSEAETLRAWYHELLADAFPGVLAMIVAHRAAQAAERDGADRAAVLAARREMDRCVRRLTDEERDFIIWKAMRRRGVAGRDAWHRIFERSEEAKPSMLRWRADEAKPWMLR